MTASTQPDLAPGNARWLYLFSSNQSPLYVQDVLTILAAPDGLHCTFRYDARYVEPSTADAWESLAPGTRVLVVFSIQQRAKFHPPAFLPIRLGELVQTHKVGSRYFVRFAVRRLVSLPGVDVAADATHDAWVERFTAELRRRVQATPYASSVSFGAPLPGAIEPAVPWDATSSPDIAFEQAVEYLSRAEAFAHARFYRVRRLSETGGAAVTLDREGVLQLRAGTLYDLEVLHAQGSAPMRAERFLVEVDGTALRLVGPQHFDVASRYDRPVFRVQAMPAAGVESRETVLAIRPTQDIDGPTVMLPVRVVSDKKRIAALTAAQTVALVAVALASTLTMLPLGLRVALAMLGALAAAGLQTFGVAALRAPMMPAAPRGADAPLPGRVPTASRGAL